MKSSISKYMGHDPKYGQFVIIHSQLQKILAF